jgi:hypothetical protein
VRNLLSVPALMEESAPGYRGEARGRTGTAPRNHPDYRSMARRTTTTTTTTTKSMSTHMRSNLAFGGSVASIAPLRRLVREGTLWAAPMNDGGVGIKSLKSSGLSTGSRSRRGRGVNMSNPKPCFQTGFSQHAGAKCGEHPAVVHIPTMQVGYYCKKCCPACSSGNQKPGKG